MIYCAVEEAFDNSLKKQLNVYEEKNKMNKQTLKNINNSHNNITPLHSFDNYSDIELPQKSIPYINNNIPKNPNLYSAYFTAQGDYNSPNSKNGVIESNLYEGTSINELKNNINQE